MEEEELLLEKLYLNVEVCQIFWQKQVNHTDVIQTIASEP